MKYHVIQLLYDIKTKKFMGGVNVECNSREDAIIALPTIKEVADKDYKEGKHITDIFVLNDKNFEEARKETGIEFSTVYWFNA